MDLVKQKIEQCARLLRDVDIDAWMIFVRETTMMRDPAMPLVVGEDVTWQSAFVYTKQGEAYALVGQYDDEDFTKSGHFTDVFTYTEDIKPELVKLIEKVDPKKLALNFSKDSEAADGLTYGMYQLLCDYLKDTPYVDRFVSSQPVISKLRACKTEDELSLLTTSAELAAGVWENVKADVRIGMSEKQVAAIIEYYILSGKNRLSFETIANAGAKSPAGHAAPSDAKLEPGDLLHVDFGIMYKAFASDIQRLLYFRKEGEEHPPKELVKAFTMVKDIITETAKLCVPGAVGHEIDAVARRMLKENGYEEYQHALGHQLGRDVHDGGALLGPLWPRYGNLPSIPLEINNVFTLELGIELPGIGYVGLEEDMVVTNNGGRFISPRQMELDVA